MNLLLVSNPMTDKYENNPGQTKAEKEKSRKKAARTRKANAAEKQKKKDAAARKRKADKIKPNPPKPKKKKPPKKFNEFNNRGKGKFLDRLMEKFWVTLGTVGSQVLVGFVDEYGQPLTKLSPEQSEYYLKYGGSVIKLASGGLVGLIGDSGKKPVQKATALVNMGAFSSAGEDLAATLFNNKVPGYRDPAKAIIAREAASGATEGYVRQPVAGYVRRPMAGYVRQPLAGLGWTQQQADTAALY